MKQHISVGIIATNKWKYFHLFRQVREMICIKYRMIKYLVFWYKILSTS